MNDAQRPYSPEQTDTEALNISARIQSAAIRAGLIKAADHSIANLPSSEREIAFEIIRSCRALPKVDEPEKSKADYARKHAFLTRGLGHDGSMDDLQVWLSRLTPYIGVPNSFRPYKGAICWYIKQQIEIDLTRQDRLQRDGSPSLKWLSVVYRLRHLRELLIGLNQTTITDAFWASMEIERRESGSKRHDLRTLTRREPQWLRRFLMDMRKTKYYDAMRAMLVFGCRPEELRKGIVVKRSEPGVITARIEGAKVKEAAGQPWREFTFDEATIPSTWIRRLDARGEFVIRVESKDALRSSMAGVSERLFVGADRKLSHL